MPGQLCQREVQVGQHVAPAFASVPAFLARWGSHYSKVRRGEAALMAMACAHQRLGWVYPFVDGNGRVMRLHTHTLLITWASYVLEVCQGQVGFVAGMLDFETLMARLEACLVFEATVEKSGVRQESLRGLHYLFLSGEEMARGDFKTMLGMSDRGATDALGALVKRGLLKSDSPQGKVRFGLPQHALRFLFPRLWPEAEADL